MTAVWTAMAKRAWLVPQAPKPGGPQITGVVGIAGDALLLSLNGAVEGAWGVKEPSFHSAQRFSTRTHLPSDGAQSLHRQR